jgi:hypothetical protein
MAKINNPVLAYYNKFVHKYHYQKRIAIANMWKFLTTHVISIEAQSRTVFIRGISINHENFLRLL